MKPEKKTIGLIVILAILFLGGGIFYFTAHLDGNGAEAGETVSVPAEPAQMNIAAPEMEAVQRDAPWPLEPAAEGLARKTLGDPRAPVIVEEFSSLTCGHCGSFHKNTFGEFKSAFIDTGMVYYVYNEFPLNKPALDGAMLARCMPEERFWTFTALLYETQDQWIFGAKDYLASLKQNAKLAGLSEDEVESCLADEEMAESLAAAMQSLAAKYSVQATPTFVFNKGATQLSGNQPITVFRETISGLAEQAGTQERINGE
jgi:thioredoxin-related protein